MTLKAVIYARRSVEERGKADESKSVTRQVENARAFATSNGWQVVPELVFVDDGISGAEFEKRPRFQEMLAAAQRREFQVLIVSEQKSIAREMTRASTVIAELARAGVEIYEYVHGKCLTPRTHTDKLMSSVQGFADEDHLVKTSERVHEAHFKLPDRDLWPGGRVFGYSKEDIINGVDRDGRPLRVGVKLKVNAEEAPIIGRAFELYASGLGFKAVARTLNLEGCPSPEPLKYRDGRPVERGWKPGTVRSLLSRELYRGVHVWNRSQKRDPVYHHVDQRPRPESEWKRTEWPHCRIISDDLWERVQQRLMEVAGRAVRFSSGRLTGRPPKREVRNMLAGLAQCGVCGSGLVVETSARKGSRVAEYVCRKHRHSPTMRELRRFVEEHGREPKLDDLFCPNAIRVSTNAMHEAVLQAAEEHVLVPGAVDLVIQLSHRDDLQEQRLQVERQRKDLEQRLKRWADAHEKGSPTAMARVVELEAKIAALPDLAEVPRLRPQVIEGRLAEWRRLLRQSPTQARAVLQRFLRGRIVFSPTADGTGYTFEAETRFDKLFEGIAVPTPAYLARYEGDLRGTEGITAGDTFDIDYGLVLERAYAQVGKGVASPTGLVRKVRVCIRSAA